jgi:hypothetical protein
LYNYCQANAAPWLLTLTVLWKALLAPHSQTHLHVETTTADDDDDEDADADATDVLAPASPARPPAPPGRPAGTGPG